jgi:hypothetical protein
LPSNSGTSKVLNSVSISVINSIQKKGAANQHNGRPRYSVFVLTLRIRNQI